MWFVDYLKEHHPELYELIDDDLPDKIAHVDPDIYREIHGPGFFIRREIEEGDRYSIMVVDYFRNSKGDKHIAVVERLPSNLLAMYLPRRMSDGKEKMAIAIVSKDDVNNINKITLEIGEAERKLEEFKRACIETINTIVSGNSV